MSAVYVLEEIDEIEGYWEVHDVRGVFATREAAELEGVKLRYHCVTEWEVAAAS